VLFPSISLLYSCLDLCLFSLIALPHVFIVNGIFIETFDDITAQKNKRRDELCSELRILTTLVKSYIFICVIPSQSHAQEMKKK
jgi:hypothetical protein